jgi:chromosome segregation ATPase
MAKNNLYEKYYTFSQEFKDKNKELGNDNNKLYDLAMLKKAMYERLKQDFFKITSAQSTTIEEYKAKENELNDDIARLRGTIAGKDSTILQNKHTITTLTNDNTNQANHIKELENKILRFNESEGKLYEDIATLNGRIADKDSTITQLNRNIVILNNRIADKDSTITQLNQNGALKNTRIEYLEESVDELSDTIQKKSPSSQIRIPSSSNSKNSSERMVMTINLSHSVHTTAALVLTKQHYTTTKTTLLEPERNREHHK